MTSHIEKFQRTRLAVENAIIAIAVMPNNHNDNFIFTSVTTFL